MANDPFRHVTPGEPLEIRAETFNVVLDSAKAFARSRLGKAADAGKGRDRSALTVLVKNNTGVDLDVRSVLKVSDSPADPTEVPDEFRNQPVFHGTAPGSDTDFIAVLDEAIPNGEIGRAVVAGTTAVTVDVSDTSHKYAKPISGDTAKLVSSATAAACQLIVRPTATVTTCVVQLQSWGTGEGGGGVVVRADATGADSITCYRQKEGGGTLIDDPALDAITVRRFTAPVRNNFEEDGYYAAFQVGTLWYAETGFRREAKGKLDGALTFGGSATMSVWEHSGSAEVDTTENITVYDWLLASGQTVASGRKVVAHQMKTASGYRWYVTSAECP
jgi:hypothetical protein